jgi:hypothetical protein
MYDEQKLQYRVAALSGGVASIQVGAFTETELKDRKLRYEDAINSVRSAIEMGVLPGGGSTLLYLAETMREEVLASLEDKDERAGAEILLKAMVSAALPFSLLSSLPCREPLVTLHVVMLCLSLRRSPWPRWRTMRGSTGARWSRRCGRSASGATG